MSWQGKNSMRRCPSAFARGAFTLVELLVVIAVIGMLIALLLPAVQKARESARRTQCGSQQRQIAQAMHQHDHVYKRLPSAYMEKCQWASAFVPLLPFLEEQPLYEQFDPKLGEDSGSNIAFKATPIALFRCPSMVLPNPPPSAVWAWSSYAVCTGSAYGHFVNSTDPEYHNGAIIDPPDGITRINQISNQDGTTKTFLLGDLDYGLKPAPGVTSGGSTTWAHGYPFASTATTAGVFNADQLVTGFRELNTFRSDHAGGVYMAMVSGSVHFVDESISPDVLNWLANRKDGKVYKGL